MKINTLHNSPEYAAKLYESLDAMFWPTVGTANQSAAIAIVDAYDAIEDMGLLTFSIKKHAAQAMDAFEKYERYLQRRFQDRYALLADVANIAAQEIAPHVDKLIKTVCNAIEAHEAGMKTNSKYPSLLRAQVFTADTLVHIAVNTYDDLVSRYTKQTTFDIVSDFRPARLADAMFHWDKVTDNFSHTSGTLDLNKEPKCNEALQVVFDIYQSDFINQAANRALRLNPAMKQYLTPQEQKHYFDETQDHA